MKIIFNSQSEVAALLTENLGVSTFTSLISDSENFVFLKAHLARLLKGADFLFPNAQWPQKEGEIADLLASEFVPSHYYRIQLQGDVLFFSKKPHDPKPFSLNVMKAKSLKAPNLLPPYVKSPHYLISELEIKEAKKKKYDDIIFFSQLGHVCEASTSNIFVVMEDQTILTPKTSSMVLEGVVRNKVIDYLEEKNVRLEVRDITESELESSIEIWFTNAVQGLRLVTEYNGKLTSIKPNSYQSVVQNFGRFGEKYK